MSARPRAVVFDVNETLFSLDPLQRRMQEAGLPENSLQVSTGQLPYLKAGKLEQRPHSMRVFTPKAGAVQVWFARVLRDGVCLSVTERFAPFKEVGTYHVRAMLTAAGITDGVDTKAAAVIGTTSSAATRLALVVLARCNNRL